MEKIIDKIIVISNWIENYQATAFLEGIIAFTLIIVTCTCFFVGEAVMGVFSLLNFILIGIPAMARCLYQMLGYNEEEK